MATNNILQATGTVLIFANSTYSPGTNTTLGTLTDDIDAAGLTTGQAREGVKADLLAVHAPFFSVDMTTELATDPAAGGSMDLYWGESHSASAAVGNMAGLTGADADYAGYSVHTLAESLKHLTYIGSLPMGVQNEADGVVIGHVGVFSAFQRYGVLVIHNNTSVTLQSDSIEMAVRFTPFFLDIAAAA